VKKEQDQQLINILAQPQNDKALLMFESNLTIGNAMEGMTIQKAKKEMGVENLGAALTMIIMRACGNFNVFKNITEDQAALLAVDIIQEYPVETLEDFLLMFSMARRGKFSGQGQYAKKLDRIDPHLILSQWMPMYLEHKAIERENRHRRALKVENEALYSDWFRKALKTALNRPREKPDTPRNITPVPNEDHFITHFRNEATKLPTQRLKQLKSEFIARGNPDVLKLHLPIIEAELQTRN